MNRAARRRRQRFEQEVAEWQERATADMMVRGEHESVPVAWCIGELFKRHGTKTFSLSDHEGGDMSASVLDAETGQEVRYSYDEWYTEPLRELLGRL